jgi:hypothetical protein
MVFENFLHNFAAIISDSRGAYPLKNGKAEIKPAEPDQGNACAGRL